MDHWGRSSKVLVTSRIKDIVPESPSTRLVDCTLSKHDAVDVIKVTATAEEGNASCIPLDDCYVLADEEPMIGPLVSAVRYILNRKKSLVDPQPDFNVRDYCEEKKRNPDRVLKGNAKMADYMIVKQVCSHPNHDFIKKLFFVLSLSENERQTVPASLALRLASHDTAEVDDALKNYSAGLLVTTRAFNYSKFPTDSSFLTGHQPEVVEDGEITLKASHYLYLKAIKSYFRNLRSEDEENYAKTAKSVVLSLTDEYFESLWSVTTASFIRRKLLIPFLKGAYEICKELQFSPSDSAMISACLGDALATFDAMEEGRKYLDTSLSTLAKADFWNDMKVKMVVASAYRVARREKDSKELLDGVAQLLQEKISSVLETPEGAMSLDSPEHALLGNLLMNVGVVYEDLGWSEKAFNLMRKGCQWLKKHDGKSGDRDLKRSIAFAHAQLGRLKRRRLLDDYGKENFKIALQMQEELEKERYPEFTAKIVTERLHTMTELAKTYRNTKDKETSRKTFEDILALQKVKYNENHMSVATTCAHLSNLHRRMGDMKRAREYANTADCICSLLVGHAKDHHLGVGKCLTALARYHRDMGELDQALKHIQKALQITKNIYGKVHPKYLSRKTVEASILRHQGRLAEALETLKSLDPMCLEGSFEEQKARIDRLKGFLYRMLDQPGESSECFQNFIDFYKRKQPTTVGAMENSETALVQAHLIYLRRGVTTPRSAALEELASLIRDVEKRENIKQQGRIPAHFAFILYLQGKVQLREGFLNDACNSFVSVYQHQRRALGWNHPRLAMTYTALAGTVYKMHEQEEGKKAEQAFSKHRLYKGMELAKKAEQIARKSVGDRHLLVAEALAHQGRLMTKLNENLTEAIGYIEDASSRSEKSTWEKITESTLKLLVAWQ
eukprot:m.24129 g.24129  ORF g.24129 m.24129 type:complete len:902 (+) comp28569_c0_seq1:1527-4232(+)